MCTEDREKWGNKSLGAGEAVVIRKVQFIRCLFYNHNDEIV
jgi:hypothetical protein